MFRKRTTSHATKYKRHSGDNVIGCAFLACIFVIFGLSTAVADEEGTKKTFNIEAQSAGRSLTLYARQAKVQLGFAAEVVENILTNPINGEYESAQALELLLEGTGLWAEYGENGIIIRRTGSPVSTSVIEGRTSTTATANGWPSIQMAAQAAPRSSTTSAVQTSSDDSGKSRKKLEEIVVTGSRIRGVQGAAPVITLTRQTIERSGFANVEQLLRAMPQNFAGGAGQQNNMNSRNLRVANGAFTATEVSVDLRGLGSASTLVLLNGRRLSGGGFKGSFVDVSSIPVTAIERVEILTDGASAIYGADAIAGVVNFILRDDYEGAETRIRYGMDGAGDMSNVRFGQVMGKSWDRSNVLFSYEYYKQDNLPNSARLATANSDIRPLGGENWSQPGGNPANIIADGQSFAIPADQDGTSLTPADFVPGTQNYRNTQEGADLLGEQERHTVFLNYTQHLADTLELFVESRYSKREAVSRTASSSLNLLVPDTNPFFVDPTGSGLTEVRVQNYVLDKDIGQRIAIGEIESYGGATGVKFELGTEWQGEISANYAKEVSTRTGINIVNRDIARAAAAGTTVETALNPFGDGSNTNPAVLDAIRSSGNGADVQQDLLSLHLDFTGELFELPGGSISLATGLAYREESLQNSRRTGASSGTGVVSVIFGANDDRQMTGVYAELYFPLVGPNNARRGLHRLEFSVAGRYEHYDDFGDTANPKLGVVWSPVESLNIRGTIGTSFKPPLLTQLDTDPSLDNSDTWFGFTPLSAIFVSGGNAALTPEEATTWTAGLQFAPDSSRLNLELTYFNISVDDRIVRPAPSLFGVFAPEFSSLVNTTPTQEQIVAIASSPRYQNFGGASAQDLIDGLVPVEAIVDFRLKNVATFDVTGFDFLIYYGFESAAGRFNVGLNSSYLLNYEQQILPTTPVIDRVNTVGNPVDLRMRGSLSWNRGGWGASAFVNFTDSYANDQTGERVDSWTTVDLQVAFDTEKRYSSAWLNDLRISLSAINVFDERPPFVNWDRAIAYDPVNASVLGQFIALEVSKSWGRW